MPSYPDTRRASTGSGASRANDAADAKVASAPLGDQLRESSGSYELVLSVVILALGGLWLDRRFGTTPWLTIIVAVLAFIGATASQYYRYKDRIAKLQAETAELRAKAVAK